jgi:hypothetical protein
LGIYPLVFLSLLFPFALFLKKNWVVRSIQVILILGAIEWIRTLYVFAQERIYLGEPWTRLSIILGSVAIFTGLSGLVFLFHSLKSRYRLKW